MKKCLSIIVMLVMSVVLLLPLAACNREMVNPNDKIDETKTQLRISNYQGGFGRVWLDNAAERFEEKYKNESFEPGKTGVEIHITSSINDTAGPTFLNGLPNNPNHIIFTENVSYDAVLAGNYAADITDIVKEQKLTEFGEDVTIEDKLDTSLSKYFATTVGKYYALPHYEAYCGIVYDKDLFDIKGFWISASGEYTKNKSNLSNGPDHRAGTYADGLPATFDEIFALCEYMTQKGVTPFTWAGGVPVVATYALVNLWADYEGKENYYLNYSHSGTATTLVNSMGGTGKPNASGTYDDMMPATPINESNADLLKRQAGRYVALDFMQRLVSNGNFYTDLSFSPSETNLTAQGTYLLSRLESTKKPIAFLFDGVWWENEADESGKFEEYSVYGETRQTRKFGWLPFPKATTTQLNDADNRRTISTNCNNSLSFINGNIKDENVLKCAKKFYQFIHTDNELQEFSVVTGTLKPMKYSIPLEKQNKMSAFGKEILALRANEYVDIVYTYARTDDFVNHPENYYPETIAWNTSLGYNPAVIFKAGNTTIKDIYDLLTA